MSTDLEQQARELATRLVMLPVNNVSRQLDAFEALILKELQRVRDEGAEDTKRLDWLEANSERQGSGDFWVRGLGTISAPILSRAAIDAAMRPTPEKESP